MTGRIRRYLFAVAATWSAIVGALMLWGILDQHRTVQELAMKEVRAQLDKDEALGSWVRSHGGIYVPVSKNTPPNPNLAHVPERDIETPSGQHLTLMNSSYVLRKIYEDFYLPLGVIPSMTSLKPLRPENAPDDWERRALLAFERGEKEVVEITRIGDKPYLRILHPEYVQPVCLKCHAHQGYRVGDVRGGIGIALPLAAYLAKESRGTLMQSMSLYL
jgi:hypothetical protein